MVTLSSSTTGSVDPASWWGTSQGFIVYKKLIEEIYFECIHQTQWRDWLQTLHTVQEVEFEAEV